VEVHRQNEGTPISEEECELEVDCEREMIGMSLLCSGLGLGMRRARLFLMLLCVVGAAAHSGMSSGASGVPLQASGTTWELLESDYPEAVFSDVAFLNSTHGWIVGEENEILASDLLVLHTSNGGDSWQLQYSHTRNFPSAIDVVDERTVWVSGSDGHLYYTLDGGETWSESAVSGAIGGLSTVEFINHTHGWTANNDVLYRTIDGGQSWQSVSGWSPDYDDLPRMMVVLSPLDIWACGYSGTYHSTDGGQTWAKMFNLGGWAMSFVSSTEAWLVDDDWLAHMTNGENWTELTVPGGIPWFRLMGPYLTDIQFVDEDHGWIVGIETPVMYTPDGGANWYRQSVPSIVDDTDPRIMAIDCINVTHGWAVGSNGVIMRTTSADSLGVRLWGGSADPLFLSAIAAVVVVITGGVFVFCRRKRRSVGSPPTAKPSSPELA